MTRLAPPNVPPIFWLRSFNGGASVHLSWEKRGQFTLTHRDADGRSSFLQVPVEIHGKPPVIAFNAAYLADALEIGSTLCLSDELSPGICRHPGGRFCVIMPMRVNFWAEQTTGEGVEVAESIDPPHHHPQACGLIQHLAAQPDGLRGGLLFFADSGHLRNSLHFRISDLNQYPFPRHPVRLGQANCCGDSPPALSTAFTPKAIP